MTMRAPRTLTQGLAINVMIETINRNATPARNLNALYRSPRSMPAYRFHHRSPFRVPRR